jgi:hypothetical protein
MKVPLLFNRLAIDNIDLSRSDCSDSRGVDFDLPSPVARMRACVVVPVRNEELALPSLVASLADQRTLDGAPLNRGLYEIILLLNNCTDHTRDVAEELRRRYGRQLILHIADVTFAPHEAHVGRARQTLFDLAIRRFKMLDRPDGLILTTDADSRPAADWIVRNEAEIKRGVEGVGGRIILEQTREEGSLPDAVRRYLLLDIGYRRALEEMRSLYAPESHDPFPRHHQHFGASLAVTAAAYIKAGGMPAVRSNEDVALYRAIVRSGGRFRHSYRVRVFTSPRMNGRAKGGLADALAWWNDRASDKAPVMVESALEAESRLARLGLWMLEHPSAMPPVALTATPEPPALGGSSEIQVTLRDLRRRCEELRRLPFELRMQKAKRRYALVSTADGGAE